MSTGGDVASIINAVTGAADTTSQNMEDFVAFRKAQNAALANTSLEQQERWRQSRQLNLAYFQDVQQYKDIRESALWKKDFRNRLMYGTQSTQRMSSSAGG